MKITDTHLIMETYEEHKEFIKYYFYFVPEAELNKDRINWIFKEGPNTWTSYYLKKHLRSVDGNEVFYQAAKEYINNNDNNIRCSWTGSSNSSIPE